jgi:CheY-like chemotaxis protein
MTPPGPGHAGALASFKILVVDDLQENRELFTALLRAVGADVTAVASADEAFAVFCEFRPDVLVSDLEMPGHDGFWLIRNIRALPPERGGATPAAAVTGLSTPEDRARVLRAGFQYHIAKPFDPESFIGIVTILSLKA